MTSMSYSQNERSSSSMYLSPAPKTDVSLTFSASAEGKRFNPEWGLDLAWINEGNLLRGANHMGRQNVSFGRSSYRVCAPLTNDVTLVKAMWQGMNQRNTLFDKVNPDLPVILNCDNGYQPSTTDGTNIDAYYTKYGQANIDHWAAMLDAHVSWMKRNASKHKVIGVSIMNEPDFNGNENELIQGTAANIRDIAKKLREDYTDNFADIVISGPNTLNNDKALTWYNTCKNYVDWGNTHQLAGSFDNYVAFYEQLQKDGKVGFNDEMHNVAEAFIGLEYGMTKGIWWGFDSRARGEFCNISRNGSRLAYAENRSKWTAACVYRNDVNKQIKAFIGGSERQANTTTYKFISLDDEVYFDGQGPLREFAIEIPSGDPGTYGTEKHTNAERVIDITQGEDVAPSYINGDYIIMNKYSTKVVTSGGSDGASITVTSYSKSPLQQWSITPVSSRVRGDFSFYDIISKSGSKRINLLNHSTQSGAKMITYNANGDANEQWYFEYAGNGYYYIRNRLSALYLATAKNSSDNVEVVQSSLITSSDRDRILWHIIPVDATCEKVAPKQPSGLTATSHTASVQLSWTENTEADLDGYMIVRQEKETGKWITVARKIKTNYFVDNTCKPGMTYVYKIRAIDYSDNLSLFSSEVEASTSNEKSLVACWDFEDNLNDKSVNMMDAVGANGAIYNTNHKIGSKSLSLSSGNYIQLPYSVANSEELTFTAWVYWNNSGSISWQRIFDFGYDKDHYMFLTPNSGSSMRFAIKNGGDEQILDCPTRLNGYTWKHVAVTIGKDKVSIYVDGSLVASTESITIRPNDIHAVLNYLGRSQFESDPMLAAYLDDVRIYNYELSESEVTDVMNGLISSINKTTAESSAVSTAYGLDGRQISPSQKGVRIIDGKKILK